MGSLQVPRLAIGRVLLSPEYQHRRTEVMTTKYKLGPVLCHLLLLPSVLCNIEMSADHDLNVPSKPTDAAFHSSIGNIWAHALRKQGEARSAIVPRTLISPDDMQVVNLVPMDGGHPLYVEENRALRTEFLQDYMILETVDPDDARMSSTDGLTLENLNGKPLLFKKSDDGKTSVNGVEVRKQKTLSDGTQTYAINGLLFNHREKVHEEFQKMKHTPF